jgi:hypothetical protein
MASKHVTGSWNWSLFIWLVVWNIWIHLDYFSIQLGMSSSQLTKSIIFQRGWNHQPVFPSHHPYFHGISTINHPYHPLIDGGRSTTNQLWLDQESFTTFPIVGPAAWPSRSCLGTTQLRKATIMPPGYTELVIFCSFFNFVSSICSQIKHYIISNIRQLWHGCMKFGCFCSIAWINQYFQARKNTHNIRNWQQTRIHCRPSFFIQYT